jgi:hypothetical protein
VNEKCLYCGQRVYQWLDGPQAHLRRSTECYFILTKLSMGSHATLWGHYVHELGAFDGVEVLEFVPRAASITWPPNQASLRGPTRSSSY